MLRFLTRPAGGVSRIPVTYSLTNMSKIAFIITSLATGAFLLSLAASHAVMVILLGSAALVGVAARLALNSDPVSQTKR